MHRSVITIIVALATLGILWFLSKATALILAVVGVVCLLRNYLTASGIFIGLGLGLAFKGLLAGLVLAAVLGVAGHYLHRAKPNLF